MGQILSQPVTEKHSENSGDDHIVYGLSCMQGWRVNMEDDHSTILNMNTVKDYQQEDDEVKQESNDDDHVAFFGVYDGHGGERAAIFTGEYLPQIIKSTPSFKKKDYVNALKEGFLNCDQAILRDFNMRDDDSGCAATSVIVTKDEIFCGNAGDSRTVMSINGFAKALSYDHKPSNEGEKTRICSAGGYVDMGRVNGNLALSRGIGDFEFKKNIDLPAEEQIVTCYPDVLNHKINFENDEFIILACDGIWDCLTSQSCVECVRRGIFERKSLTTICEEIMELCCAPTSDGSGIGCDNMSIVILALLDHSKNETLDQWYEKIIKKIEINQSKESNSSKFGSISNPYNDIYKDIYGQYYEIGQQAQNSNSRNQSSGNGLGGYSMFGGLPGLRNQEFNEDDNTNNDNNDNEKDLENNEESEVNGAISLQKLLASNAITSENGVIYLDTSSAQSLLAHYGIAGSEDVNFEDVEDVENPDVHEKHIEEDIEKDDK
ncbi:protein phosphatase 2C homolog 2 [[Candida] jaroonii]|uniref:Protein phosphatase 2C homolog 2 n=1 Tax=[Candida] jaroonii TaxID=467808 RepID=A0ACA9Y397_9ASCO|nr:protein phosphatase 2C homolog 2 [[Candida] jaroonii]